MAKEPDTNPDVKDGQKPTCGIVMPMSAIDGCSADHWAEILEILQEVATDAGFETLLVSEADDVGIIQKRIIQNLYACDIVICDVSAKNPNVMFELGLRLAFDKPTIIVKDDITDYSFDTAPIEHLSYPRDLRYAKILEFRKKLEAKLKGTYEKFKDDKTASTFLKAFGEFQVVRLDTKEVPTEEYLLDGLRELKQEMTRLRNTFVHITDKRRPFSALSSSAIEEISKLVLTTANSIAKSKGMEPPLSGPELEQIKDYVEEVQEVQDACGMKSVFERVYDKLVDDAIPF